MFSFDSNYRVCYGDTDMMGVVYYGNYPRIYEIGRNDMIREIWKSYKEMEKDGIILPARSLKVNYLKPAYYDDLLTTRTIIKEIPKVKFKLITQIYNENNELINEGEVVLVFMNAATGRPCKAPEELCDILKNKMR
jgi:acyl-CoA thioester hydrolase